MMKILCDFDTTVSKALQEIDPYWYDLEGVIVCGTHSPTKEKAEEIIQEISFARKNNIPFLGICAGHQLAAIEWARHNGVIDATSEEWDTKGTFVVRKRPEGLKVGVHDGETYWNNYEVIPEIIAVWTKKENFITTQSHPEYQSSIDAPHPLLVKFIQLCKKS